MLCLQYLHMQLHARIIASNKNLASGFSWSLVNKRVTRLRESSCSWLARVMARNMEASLVAKLTNTELNIRYFVNLIVLLEEGNITQTELGRRIGEAPYATSRIIDALEEKNWVERRKDPNSRRTHLIALTSKGLDVAKGLPAIVQRVNNESLSRLDKQEQQELVRLLQKAIGIGGDIEG